MEAQYRYVEGRSNPLIKFNYFKAYQAGIRTSSLDHMKWLGFKVTNLEKLPQSGCTLFEVKKFSQNKILIPNYIELLEPCWEFEHKHPL